MHFTLFCAYYIISTYYAPYIYYRYEERLACTSVRRIRRDSQEERYVHTHISVYSSVHIVYGIYMIAVVLVVCTFLYTCICIL